MRGHRDATGVQVLHFNQTFFIAEQSQWSENETFLEYHGAVSRKKDTMTHMMPHFKNTCGSPLTLCGWTSTVCT